MSQPRYLIQIHNRRPVFTSEDRMRWEVADRIAEGMLDDGTRVLVLAQDTKRSDAEIDLAVKVAMQSLSTKKAPKK